MRKQIEDEFEYEEFKERYIKNHEFDDKKPFDEQEELQKPIKVVKKQKTPKKDDKIKANIEYVKGAKPTVKFDG